MAAALYSPHGRKIDHIFQFFPSQVPTAAIHASFVEEEFEQCYWLLRAEPNIDRKKRKLLQ